MGLLYLPASGFVYRFVREQKASMHLQGYGEIDEEVDGRVCGSGQAGLCAAGHRDGGMRRLMVDGWVGRLACGMMLVAGMSGMGLGQSGTTANSTVDLNATTVRTVTGQVINA